MGKENQAGKTAEEKKRPMSARYAAVQMLRMVYEEKKFSNEAKEKYLHRLEEKRERALATLLFEGCLDHSTEVDYIINQFSKLPVKKMKPAIAAILRITVYQLKFTDKIPASAACNEAVILTKQFGFSGLSGFVNGVARTVARTETIAYPSRKTEFLRYCSVKYSMPLPILELLIQQYKEDGAEEICKAFFERKDCLSAYCLGNSTKVEKYYEVLEKEGCPVKKGLYSPHAVSFEEVDSPEKLFGFAEGKCYFMDESSMQAVFAAGITGGEAVLDLCGAPGGKTVVAADLLKQGETLENKKGGSVISRDLTEKKTRLLEENKKRCRLENITVQQADASVFSPEDEERYDIVFADVPCSGLGIIGRKPDIKLFFQKENLEELYLLQRKILKNAARYVKPGGVLIFSTCTLNREENMGGFAYLESECGMQPESLNPYLSEKLHGDTTQEGYLQMLPNLHHTDGFFLARFRKPEKTRTKGKE